MKYLYNHGVKLCGSIYPKSINNKSSRSDLVASYETLKRYIIVHFDTKLHLVYETCRGLKIYSKTNNNKTNVCSKNGINFFYSIFSLSSQICTDKQTRQS